MRPARFLLPCIIAAGCANNFSAALVGSVVAPGPGGPVSDIRVRNASSFTLRNVIVGKVHYGDIGAGETTVYRSWGPAYPHPRVRFDVGEVHLRRLPLYHFGETALGAGRFTYVLTVGTPTSRTDFSVTVVKD
jgi:hypothetical protein